MGPRQPGIKTFFENALVRLGALITATGLICGVAVKVGTYSMQKQLDECRKFKCLDQTVIITGGETIIIRDLIDEVCYLRLIAHYSDATASYYRTRDDAQLDIMENSQKTLASYIKKKRQCKSGDCPLQDIITSSDTIKIGQQMYIIPRSIMTLLSNEQNGIEGK